MSLAQVFYLHFLAPLRGSAAYSPGCAEAGARGDFPSDTLSAALVLAAIELGGERVPPEEIASLAAEPPWIVTSLLPWVGLGGRPVRFVPRPVDLRLGERGRDAPFRNVAYVSPGLLRTPHARPIVSRCGALAATADEGGAELPRIAWRRAIVRAAATMDRATGAAAVFYDEQLAMGMSAEAGAWLVVRAENPGDLDFVRVLLSHLADSGVGGGRARGLGRFAILRSAIETLDEDEDPDRFRVLLGYASPDAWTEEALQHPRARYDVVRREGVAHGVGGGLGVRRCGLRLLAPGSVLPDRGPVVGRTRDITPDAFDAHRIWRDGRTLAVPLPRVDIWGPESPDGALRPKPRRDA